MVNKPTYEELEKKVQELEKQGEKFKIAEDSLLESEEKYRNLFNNVQVGIFRTRISDGKVLEAECNDRFAKTYGFDNRNECISEYISADHYVDPEIRERMLAQLREAGEVNDFDARFSRRDGSIVWVRFSARYCFEEGYLEGIGYDITHEKEAEEALRESEERYRTLVDNLPVAVYQNTPGPEGTFLMANPAFCKMFGYDSEEEVKKLSASDFYANPKERKQYSDNLISSRSRLET